MYINVQIPHTTNHKNIRIPINNGESKKVYILGTLIFICYTNDISNCLNIHNLLQTNFAFSTLQFQSHHFSNKLQYEELEMSTFTEPSKLQESFIK